MLVRWELPISRSVIALPGAISGPPPEHGLWFPTALSRGNALSKSGRSWQTRNDGAAATYLANRLQNYRPHQDSRLTLYFQATRIVVRCVPGAYENRLAAEVATSGNLEFHRPGVYRDRRAGGFAHDFEEA